MKTTDEGFGHLSQRGQARAVLRQARERGIDVSHRTARQLVSLYAKRQQERRTEQEAGE